MEDGDGVPDATVRLGGLVDEGDTNSCGENVGPKDRTLRREGAKGGNGLQNIHVWRQPLFQDYGRRPEF